MARLFLAFLFTLSAFGGCAVWTQPPPGSACVLDHPHFYWLSRNPGMLPLTGLRQTLDPAIADPAFTTGFDANGVQRFFLGAPGEHILEIFVYFANSETDSWVLDVNDEIVDARFEPRPLRLGPSNRPRVVPLIGVVQGGQDITLRSNSPGYAVIGARWTPRGEFETVRVPELLARIRQLQADPFFENRRSSRAERIIELAELAIRSRRPAAANEALLQLTRATFWLAAENHQPRDTQRLAELFDLAAARIPTHPAIRQMVSAACAGTMPGVRNLPRGAWCSTIQPVKWDVQSGVSLDGAPEWAANQWKLRARLEALTAWWVEKRQRANGELGGGWGDDVEILRDWAPLALGLGSEVAARGIRQIADGVWNSGTLANGYDRAISDVEHSSEPTSDTLPLIAALSPFDNTVRARLAETAACAPNWLAQQPDGHWRFKSSWFNCREHDPSPARALDVYMNTLALKPAVWHAYLARDAKLIELLARYGESWLNVLPSTRHGKPAGVFPSVLRSADGEYLLGKSWDKPEAEWDYYQFSENSQSTLETYMRALHELTGDPKWQAAGGPATLAVDLAQVAAQSARLEQRLSVNFDLLTTEVMYTDRVDYKLPGTLQRSLFGSTEPFYAVTWPAVPARFARAVLQATPGNATVKLYSFEDQPANATIRLWQLKPGAYQWTCGGKHGTFTVAARPTDLEIPLPPKTETELAISPQS